ncbi:hypothetical protein J6590_042389 [Homalodisca vitripennis]|nr:hypothetical protein J6590_042389 [Homalodisca vitripennis]
MAVAPSHVEAHITHVDKDGSLIKVYAQTDKINYCYIEKLLYQLRSVFENNSDLKPKTSSDIQVGVVCFAKFEDDTYYRAKIESIQNVQQYMVTVVFIDHGNKAEVHVKDIRLMSKVMNLIANKKLFQDILLLPGLANDYYLYGITTREKEWDEYSLDYLRKRLCNTDLTCTVYENEWGRIIRIVQEEKDPSAYLTKMSKAHSIPLHVQEALIRQISQKKAIPVPEFNVTLPPPQLLMQQPPPARLPNMSQPPPGIRMGSDINSFSSGQSSSLSSRYPTINSSIRPGIPGMTVRRPEVPAVPPPPVHSLQFSTEMLAMGVIHPVFVSHVEDGPYSFAVQVQVGSRLI